MEGGKEDQRKREESSRQGERKECWSVARRFRGRGRRVEGKERCKEVRVFKRRGRRVGGLQGVSEGERGDLKAGREMQRGRSVQGSEEGV